MWFRRMKPPPGIDQLSPFAELGLTIGVAPVTTYQGALPVGLTSIAVEVAHAPVQYPVRVASLSPARLMAWDVVVAVKS